MAGDRSPVAGLKPDIAPDMVGQFGQWRRSGATPAQGRTQKCPGDGEQAMALDQIIHGRTDVAPLARNCCIHVICRPLARTGPHVWEKCRIGDENDAQGRAE